MNAPALEVRGLTAGYGPVAVLREISLTVRPGEFTALLGSNGAGKTTFLRAASGLIHPVGGQIHLNGRDVTGWPVEQRVRAGLALVPENRQLFGPMTVLENLLLGAHLVRRDRRRVAGLLEGVLELFPSIRRRLRQRAETLSGGEQQMLAIGRALMADPAILLLDEPSMGLAPAVVRQLFAVLRSLCARGMAMLVVEQNVLLTLQAVRRAYVLERGRLVLEGDAQALVDDPRVRRAYIGEQGEMPGDRSSRPWEGP